MSELMGAEAHGKIPDSWFAETNNVWDCKYRNGVSPRHDSSTNAGKGGTPRAIRIQSDGTTNGNSAFVRGYLWDETPLEADDYYMTAGVEHPLRFAKIYAEGTTARGVKVLY